MIFIHTGTNEFDNPDFNTESMEVEYVDIIFKIIEMCPESKIIISSLLPRKEQLLKILVASCNDFLFGICSIVENVVFMRNNNIKRQMLTDEKHIS